MKKRLKEFFEFSEGEKRSLIEFSVLSFIILAVITAIVILLYRVYFGGF